MFYRGIDENFLTWCYAKLDIINFGGDQIEDAQSGGSQ